MFRSSFPIYTNQPNLVYLDSPASALKPQCVIDAVLEYYTDYSANIARGLYALSERATKRYENVRTLVAKFINAPSPEEIIFTRNTTESLNLLAYTLTDQLHSGDEIVITEMEHHANFVPWQQLAQKHRLKLILLPFNKEGVINPETLNAPITPRTKLFSFTHASNVLGTINPAKEFIRIAKNINPDIITIIDAAQSAPHIPINVQDIDCDFLAFSSHKLFGPTGSGVLWGKSEQLEKLPPFLYGGEMVKSVTREKTIFKDFPHRFEAGTPAIAEVISMGEAINFIESIGFPEIQKHEQNIARYTFEKLTDTFGDAIQILGPRDPTKRVPLFSFTLDGIHPHDIAQILAKDNVCIRAGSHCAIPAHLALPLDSPASARIGISLYTTKKDIDLCIQSLKKAREIFRL